LVDCGGVGAPIDLEAGTDKPDIDQEAARNPEAVVRRTIEPLCGAASLMKAPRFDLTPFLHRDEGQHFDRKSMFEGKDGTKRARDRRKVRDQVAEYVAAFANAEGGVLILGIEDDGTITGHRLPSEPLSALLKVPQVRLRPPQPSGFLVRHGTAELVVFDVPTADGPVMVEGDGFPLRMGDRTVAASETQIQALKLRGLVESWESRPSAVRLADLDLTLIERARSGAGLVDLSDEEYLLKRKLADRRGQELVLRRGAELLFAKDGPDHPNAGLRLFRVVGTERRLGAEHNVEERPRFEGNLPSVLPAAFAAIDSIIRRPARLVGTHFRTVPEYPEFSWREAVLNAAAHRDYNVEGRTTEVWFFDDRVEITSPGGLVPDLALDQLLSLERVHVSRNPRTMRALVDLGLVRDQGEGIPRMFAEMAGLFLPAPTIEVSTRDFRLTLRNTPTLTAEDKDFVARLGDAELTDQEFRALLECSRTGRIDNARLRTIAGLDTLGASTLLRRLRDRGLLELHAAGAASFYDLGPSVGGEASAPDRSHADPQGPADRGELGTDRGELGTDRGELGTDRGELPDALRQRLSALGPRPRSAALRPLLLDILRLHPWTPAELAALLGFTTPAKLVERHLTPMVREGIVARAFPNEPTHPDQAYSAVRTGFPAREKT
jgi:ATP-dependent DNA helicase RecG